jgi:pimeloyl-ACP methyl ester carboxylesterase
MTTPITERTVVNARHTTFYLEAGPEDGVPIILVHGWPELAISWRHQIPVLAGLGFRVIAPDMRGYGRSSRHDHHADYRMEECVADLLELLKATGREKAIWVGHDFGAAVVWSLASHHPEACIGVANLCVPYLPKGFTLENVVALVNREIYPQEQYPHGQWAYWNLHVEHPGHATVALGADVERSVRMIFRRGVPELLGKATGGATIAAPDGWRPLLEMSKAAGRDERILDEADYWAYVSSLKRNGFEAADSYYRNNEANGAYAARSVNGGRLDLPVLFIHALFDPTCDTMVTELATPMREHCSDLSEQVVRAGHWVQQEKGPEVSAALVRWLALRFPELWRVEAPESVMP